MTQPTFQNQNVAVVFDSYPPQLYQKLTALRQLIFEVASEDHTIGKLEETLKWGQPSYLTSQTQSGSTVRIDRANKRDTQYALYFICHTKLVETFRQRFPDLSYDGDRAIVFDVADTVPTDDIKECIHLALTYHLRKKKKSQ